MSIYGILGLIGLVGGAVTLALRANSQHMANRAKDQETRQEWEAEKADVSKVGCTVVIVAILLIVFFGLTAKG